MNQNLQTVATGAEEMGIGIKEIAKNATEAAQVTDHRGASRRKLQDATVSKLGESSAEIGQVIKIITSIAPTDQPAGSEREHRSGSRGQEAGKGGSPWSPTK